MTTTLTPSAAVISKEQLLQHWQGHRTLTRKVIEAFPENELFNFSIGGMRPFNKLATELIAIAVPSLEDIISKGGRVFDEKGLEFKSKQELLDCWDAQTEKIDALFNQIPEEDFPKTFNLFGEYEFPIYQNILYFIDNEIHHRGQGYVYLRALGIEPPFFWDRY